MDLSFVFGMVNSHKQFGDIFRATGSFLDDTGGSPKHPPKINMSLKKEENAWRVVPQQKKLGLRVNSQKLQGGLRQTISSYI